MEEETDRPDGRRKRKSKFRGETDKLAKEKNKLDGGKKN